MSNLNPGGSRNRGGGRVFGAIGIARAIADNLKRKRLDASGSLATKPHAHSREIARRLRQQQKRREHTPQ